MATNSNAACQSCRFFDDHKTNGAQAAGDQGLCRYNPPVSQPDPQSQGLWPVVASKDWCGHFTADVTPAE